MQTGKHYTNDKKFANLVTEIMVEKTIDISNES